MAKYCLVGQDGNAYALMGYTGQALRAEGLGDLVKEMQEKATSGDYNNLICVCSDYVEMANKKAVENGYEDDEDDYYDDEDDDDEDW